MKRSFLTRFRHLFASLRARLRMWWERRCAERERKQQFALDDFIAQMEQLTKPGLISKVLQRTPGMDQLSRQIDTTVLERAIARSFAIYDSMAAAERENPELLNGSRRRRIADGAGVRAIEVSQFINEFRAGRDLMNRRRRGGPRSLWRD